MNTVSLPRATVAAVACQTCLWVACLTSQQEARHAAERHHGDTGHRANVTTTETWPAA